MGHLYRLRLVCNSKQARQVRVRLEAGGTDPGFRLHLKRSLLRKEASKPRNTDWVWLRSDHMDSDTQAAFPDTPLPHPVPGWNWAAALLHTSNFTHSVGWNYNQDTGEWVAPVHLNRIRASTPLVTVPSYSLQLVLPTDDLRRLALGTTAYGRVIEVEESEDTGQQQQQQEERQSPAHSDVIVPCSLSVEQEQELADVLALLQSALKAQSKQASSSSDVRTLSTNVQQLLDTVTTCPDTHNLVQTLNTLIQQLQHNATLKVYATRLLQVQRTLQAQLTSPPASSSSSSSSFTTAAPSSPFLSQQVTATSDLQPASTQESDPGKTAARSRQRRTKRSKRGKRQRETEQGEQRKERNSNEQEGPRDSTEGVTGTSAHATTPNVTMERSSLIQKLQQVGVQYSTVQAILSVLDASMYELWQGDEKKLTHLPAGSVYLEREKAAVVVAVQFKPREVQSSREAADLQLRFMRTAVGGGGQLSVSQQHYVLEAIWESLFRHLTRPCHCTG